MLILIMVNSQGHDIYVSPNPPFASKAACEVRSVVALERHKRAKKALCVEAYNGK